MIKTTYQTPELRDANDNVVQEGSFGKNTALANSTNDGWIDYVMNNLEALHDTIGDSAPTLDGNGHVVEPANLAIGDEDGNRIKNSYLKLTGGKVTGVASFRTDLRMLDNQDNRWGGLYVPGTTSTVQYLSLYGGTRATGDARLNLYNVGNGKFELTGYSTDGANAYTLTHDNNGNLNWRGYPLAWKKDYLPLSGGTLSGWLQFSSQSGRIQMNRSSSNHDGALGIYGGSGYSTGAYLWLHGVGKASQAGCFGLRAVTDGSNYKELQGRPDGTLTWGGKNIERVDAIGNTYVKYVSGFLICWGSANNVTTSGTSTTFSVPFLNGPMVFTSTLGNYKSWVAGVTTTGCTLYSDGNNTVRYVAIGRWA